MSNSSMTSSATAEDILLEPFCRKSIRQLLKCWGNIQRFSSHPLIHLNIVDTHRINTGYADTATGRGMALLEVLQNAIEALKPPPDCTDRQEKCWRPYLIIKEQYLKNRSPNYLAAQYNIERSTYNHEQAKALDMLADFLYKREVCSLRTRSGSAEVSTERQGLGSIRPPFLAPARTTHALTGRSEIFSHLKQQLMNGTGCHGIALRGMVGIGKTSLCVALAHDQDILNHFQDGVLWANLGQSPDLSSILELWSCALGFIPQPITGYQNLEARIRALHNNIGMRRILIIIDDAWKVKDALLLKIGGPRCAHLLTTRVPEVALEFAGLSTLSLNELNMQESLQLLRQIAPDATVALGEKAHEIASYAGGLPLALVFFGKNLRHGFQSYQMRRLQKAVEALTSAEIRLQLTYSGLDFSHKAGSLVEASTSLKQIFAESEHAISPQARKTLRMLSVFPSKPNTFSEEAALTVSRADVDTLDELCDQGFIESDGAGRYAIHQVLADFGRSGLIDTQAYEQFVHFFVDLVNSSCDPIHLYAETTNIFAALEFAYKLCMLGELMQGVLAFFPFLEQNELLDQAEVLLWRAQQAARVIQVQEAQEILQHYLERLILRDNSNPAANKAHQQATNDSSRTAFIKKDDHKEPLEPGTGEKEPLRIVESEIKISYSTRNGTWFAHRVTNE